jgi:hypothetical protein
MRSIFLLPVFLLVLAGRVNAQSVDTLAALKQFMRVCNDYQQLPVKLEVEMQNSTNFVTGREDTGRYQATFCLRKEGSYIAYGDMEQLADDSMVLLVSRRLKRMILYTHRQSVLQRMQQYMGWRLQDSSVLKAAAAYRAEEGPGDGDTSDVVLTSRKSLPHTDLPAETIRVKYHRKGLAPFELEQRQRRLIRISADLYKELAAQPDMKERLLAVNDSSQYIIKEQISVYRYLTISHREQDRLPVRISDRIAVDIPGRYRPVGAYAGFLVTRQ